MVPNSESIDEDQVFACAEMKKWLRNTGSPLSVIENAIFLDMSRDRCKKLAHLEKFQIKKSVK